MGKRGHSSELPMIQFLGHLVVWGLLGLGIYLAVKYAPQVEDGEEEKGLIADPICNQNCLSSRNHRKTP